MEENVKKIMTTNDKFEFEYISNNVDDTKLLGKEFAKYITKDTIITLNGELGSGKTVFLMGIASHFGIENDVCSPTFTLVNEYNTNAGFPIFHFDVYRLHDSNEFMEGVGTDYFYSGACLIEWGDEIIEDILPEETIHIDITKNDENTRTFKIWR
jgi:tRNA threonylcarbamoyladenosine biosynthesis protein TsaE